MKSVLKTADRRKLHLGNVRVVVNDSAQVEQSNHYYALGGPWGDLDTEQGFQPYKYNGKELDRMHGLDLYDYGARLYDPAIGLFTSMDPLCEKYYHLNPYSYCGGDPVNAVDVEGRSTWVINKGDGKYEVYGGNLHDNDRHVYVGHVKNDRFVPEKAIGMSSSITSFYNSDRGEWATGSIIDTNDKSGDKFLSRIFTQKPPMFDDYIVNATNNKPYDFKVTNGTNRKIDGIDVYRGMPIDKNANEETIFTSARDVGNIAAGYIAGSNGMSWKASRMAFDAYESYSSKRFKKEGASTQNAEYYGWEIGYNSYSSRQKLNNLLKSIKSLLGF